MVSASSGGGFGGGNLRRGRGTRTRTGGAPQGRPDFRNPFRQGPNITQGQGGKPRPRLPGTGPTITGSGGGGGFNPFRRFKLPPGIGRGLYQFPPGIGRGLGYVTLIPAAIEVFNAVKEGRVKDAARIVISSGLSYAVFTTIFGISGAAAVAKAIFSGGTLTPLAIATFLGGTALATGASVGTGTGTDALLRKLGLEDKKGYAEGGGVTRGGKTQGEVRRTIGGTTKKGKYKRTLAQKPGKVEITSPGADAGGEKKVFDFFGFVKGVVDKFNPFNAIKETGEELGKTDYFGPILAITSKIIAGQKPSASDYKNVGIGINLLIAKGIQDQQLKGGIVAAFAEGGMVDPDVLAAAETGGDISNWVARTFQAGIESKVERNLRMIRENAEKSKQDSSSGPGPGPGADPGGVDSSLPDPKSAEMYRIAAALSTEGSGANSVVDIMQVVVNRKASGRYGKTFTDILAAGRSVNSCQFQGVWKRPGGPNAFRKIQTLEDASRWSGQSQNALLGIIKNIQDPSLQANSANHVGGALEFRAAPGYYKRFGLVAGEMGPDGRFYNSSWRGGPGDNQYLKQAGKDPTLAAAASFNLPAPQPAPPGGASPGGVRIPLGKGYGSGGSKIAGELGRFIDAKGLGGFGSGVHRHPEHRPWEPESGHSQGSLHYASKGARAIDIGGYGPNIYRSKGYRGVDDQTKILAAIAEFNKTKGVSPVQVYHEGNDARYHNDHVHVAYAKGGETLGFPHLATLGEKGKEIVIDADSSVPGPVKDMLLAINQAKGVKGVMQAIQQYAPYDMRGEQTIVIPDMSGDEYDEGQESGGGFAIALGGGEGGNSDTQILYKGG